MSGKELRIGFGGGNLRIWIPLTRAGIRYCLKNPKSFVIGVYGFDRWREEYQKSQKYHNESLEKDRVIREKNEKLKELGTQLSKLKRNKAVE